MITKKLGEAEQIACIIVLAVHASLFEPDTPKFGRVMECPVWLIASRETSRKRALELMHAHEPLRSFIQIAEDLVFYTFETTYPDKESPRQLVKDYYDKFPQPEEESEESEESEGSEESDGTRTSTCEYFQNLLKTTKLTLKL